MTATRSHADQLGNGFGSGRADDLDSVRRNRAVILKAGGALSIGSGNVFGGDDMNSASYSDRWRQPFRTPLAPSSLLDAAGSSLANVCPVYDFFTRATCSGVPCATIRPPSSPPSGPRSMIQSALRITSMLCSMMMMLLPRSVSRCRTSSSLLTSSKCSPVVGSSSRYRVLPVCRLLKLARQLDPLRLAARQRHR